MLSIGALSRLGMKIIIVWGRLRVAKGYLIVMKEGASWWYLYDSGRDSLEPVIPIDSSVSNSTHLWHIRLVYVDGESWCTKEEVIDWWYLLIEV